MKPRVTLFGQESGAAEHTHRYTSIMIDGYHGSKLSITRYPGPQAYPPLSSTSWH